MVMLKMEPPVKHFVLLTFLVFLGSSGANADGICDLVNCGKGTCVLNSSSLLQFDCNCFAGWTKYSLLPLCIIPNCSVNFGCVASPSPSPPSPSSSSDYNILDPCTYAWCGDGTCKEYGTAYTCNCNPGSANLLNLTFFPCFKECSMGADCDGNLLPRISADSSSSPPNSAPYEVLSFSGNRDASILLLFISLLLPWT